MKLTSRKNNKIYTLSLITENIYCEEMETRNTFHFEYFDEKGVIGANEGQISITATVSEKGLTIIAHKDEYEKTQEEYTVELTQREQRKLETHLNDFYESMRIFASMPFGNPFLSSKKAFRR